MSDDPSNRRKLGANRNWTRSAGGGFLLKIVAISASESTRTTNTSSRRRATAPERACIF
jgi:hypothetical protein